MVFILYFTAGNLIGLFPFKNAHIYLLVLLPICSRGNYTQWQTTNYSCLNNKYPEGDMKP